MDTDLQIFMSHKLEIRIRGYENLRIDIDAVFHHILVPIPHLWSRSF